ncbi:MAG: c-type cytochrome [Chitinophagaceae bacterium]
MMIGLFIVTTGIWSCTKEIIEKPAIPRLDIENASAPVLGVAELPGRALAANCFQCHGTNGYAGNLKIASMGATELISKMTSFKSKDPKADIMNFHASAYSTDDINLIAAYFSKQ